MRPRCDYFECEYVNKLLREISLKDSNIISVLNKIFINCFKEYLDKRSGCVDRYISLYSQYITELLYRELRCDQIKDLLNRASEYVRNIVNYGKLLNVNIVVLRLETKTRLTIHTKDPMIPIEISLSWDPYLNVPYIPSTSIKGIVRDYFEESGVKLGNYDSRKLLGDLDNVGLVIFHDAYPVNCSNTLIEPDVLTPHYSEVREEISEIQVNPVPIVFPTIARGVVFNLPIYIRRDFDSRFLKDLADKIMEALRRGVGARTSVGYGFVEVSLS